jgi:hypothetical protein
LQHSTYTIRRDTSEFLFSIPGGQPELVWVNVRSRLPQTSVCELFAARAANTHRLFLCSASSIKSNEDSLNALSWSSRFSLLQNAFAYSTLISRPV